MKRYKGFVIGLMTGALLMAAFPTLAATVKQYALTGANYPLRVNGAAYEDEQLPVMNYKGSTYVPLRAVGQLLGADVAWNDDLRRVEIRYGDGQTAANSAFRNVHVSGSGGRYTVTGEARVFEATMNYAVEDGHNYLLEQMHTLNEGAPAWSHFELNIVIPQEQQPKNGTLMLELFEYSAKDGSKINTLSIPLETFTP